LIVFPNCKINLGLTVINKRSDGYHNLETIFYPVSVTDILELTPSLSSTEITCTGLPVSGSPADNLCLKAWYLLKQDFPSLPPVNFHLHKIIPMGAGLGGGSADGAFALAMLNEKFALGLTSAKLIDYALKLGSDCPFFILNKPCYATGRGEVMEEIMLDLSFYSFILVNPGVHVPTGWAFSQLKPRSAGANLKQHILRPIETWKDTVLNDFEEAVAKTYPVILSIKNRLYQQGAVYASMTGSGSTVYGIFPKGQEIQLDFPKEFRVIEVV
jgi:4-diphosphocytidyl-2-C-methyl-D-erythritol kinase